MRSRGQRSGAGWPQGDDVRTPPRRSGEARPPGAVGPVGCWLGAGCLAGCRRRGAAGRHGRAGSGVDDGDTLLYHSKRSGDLTFPLDIPLGSLGDVLDLDGNVEDPRQVVELLKALAGDDVLKIGTRELMPVFERWTAELGAAMGGTLGESGSSPA